MPVAFILGCLELHKQQIIQETVRKRQLRDASNPMSLTDFSFISNYRLNKAAFSMVLANIGPYLKESTIPALLRLAATLKFLATGSFQGVVANDMNICIGRSTMSKVMWNVIESLENELCPVWIKLQMTEEETIVSNQYFFERYGIPNVVGCVDGTHIRITKPSSDASLFIIERDTLVSMQ